MSSPPHLAALLDSLNEQLVARHEQAENTIQSLRAQLTAARRAADASPGSKEQALKSEIAVLQHRLRGSTKLVGEQEELLSDALKTSATRALCSALRSTFESHDQSALQRCFQRWASFGLDREQAQTQAQPRKPPSMVGFGAADELLDELRSQLEAAEDELKSERLAKAAVERSARLEVERLESELSVVEAQVRASMAAAAAAEAEAKAALVREEAVAVMALSRDRTPLSSPIAGGKSAAVHSPVRPALALPPSTQASPSAKAALKAAANASASGDQSSDGLCGSSAQDAMASRATCGPSASSHDDSAAHPTAAALAAQRDLAVRDLSVIRQAFERVAAGPSGGRLALGAGAPAPGHFRQPILAPTSSSFTNAAVMGHRLDALRKWPQPQSFMVPGQLTSSAMRSASAAILQRASMVQGH